MAACAAVMAKIPVSEATKKRFDRKDKAVLLRSYAALKFKCSRRDSNTPIPQAIGNWLKDVLTGAWVLTIQLPSPENVKGDSTKNSAE